MKLQEFKIKNYWSEIKTEKAENTQHVKLYLEKNKEINFQVDVFSSELEEFHQKIFNSDKPKNINGISHSTVELLSVPNIFYLISKFRLLWNQLKIQHTWPVAQIHSSVLHYLKPGLISVLYKIISTSMHFLPIQPNGLNLLQAWCPMNMIQDRWHFGQLCWKKVVDIRRQIISIWLSLMESKNRKCWRYQQVRLHVWKEKQS